MKQFVKDHFLTITWLLLETFVLFISIICMCFTGDFLYIIPISIIILLNVTGICLLIESYKEFKNSNK